MQILVLCSAHFNNWENRDKHDASLPLTSISPCSPSSLLSSLVRMSLSSCWSLFDSLIREKKLNSLCVLLRVEVMFHTSIGQRIEPHFLIWGNSALSCAW